MIKTSAGNKDDMQSPVTRRGFYGFTNPKLGKASEYFWYNTVKKIDSEHYAVEIRENRWKIIDSFGNDILNGTIYDEINSLKNSLILVKSNNKFGYINIKGEIIHPFIYERATSFYENRAFVKDDIKWRIIDISGKEVAELQVNYDDISDFNEDLAVVYLDWKYGFIDINGNEVIPLQFESAYKFSDGLACVEMSSFGGFGFIDKTGSIKIPCIYTSTGYFEDGFVSLQNKKMNGWIIIDKNGNEIRPYDSEVYDTSLSVDRFYFGNSAYLYIIKNNKIGLVNRNFEYVIQPIYDNIELVDLGNSNILAKVCKNNQWGIVDRNGNVVVPCRYDFIGDTQNYDPEEGVIMAEIDYLQRNNLLTAVKLKGKWGILNMNGDEVIPTEYDEIEFGSDDEDGISLRCSDNFINRAQRENDEKTAEYEENDDYLCSDSPNYDEIDPMEIRRDAWGNRYSLGEKMFDDYMNRNNKDSDYD